MAWFSERANLSRFFPEACETTTQDSMETTSDSRVWKLIPCCLWAMLMLPALAEGTAFPADKRPEDIGRRLIAAYPAEEPFMMYRTEECRAIHYAEVCAAVGVVRLAALIGADAEIERVANRFRNVDKEGPENTRNHVDANVYGILPLELAMLSQRLPSLERTAEPNCHPFGPEIMRMMVSAFAFIMSKPFF